MPVPGLTWPRSVISVHIAMTMSDFTGSLQNRIGASKTANTLAMVVNQNIIHGPRPDILLAWIRCCLAIPCFVQLHVQSSGILDLTLCFFDPLIQFSPSELMQTICIFADFSVIVDTVSSKLSQAFVLVTGDRCQDQRPRYHRRHRWKRLRLKQPWAS